MMQTNADCGTTLEALQSTGLDGEISSKQETKKDNGMVRGAQWKSVDCDNTEGKHSKHPQTAQ